MPKNHMLLPKPNGRRRTRFIPALPAGGLAFALDRLMPRDRKAMAQIAETSDLLRVGRRSWLLVPADARLLDTLATFGAAAEDRENDLEDGPDEGEEDDRSSDWEEDRSDAEPDDFAEGDGVPPKGATKSREAFREARAKPREELFDPHSRDGSGYYRPANNFPADDRYEPLKVVRRWCWGKPGRRRNGAGFVIRRAYR